jgi:hypothetical protein
LDFTGLFSSHPAYLLSFREEIYSFSDADQNGANHFGDRAQMAQE